MAKKRLVLSPYQQNFVDMVQQNRASMAVWGHLTGKTLTAAVIAAKWCVEHKNAHVIVVSPLCNPIYAQYFNSVVSQVNIDMASGLRSFLRRLEVKMRHNGSYCATFPANPAVIRGLHPDLIIVDDLDMCSPEVYEVVNRYQVVDGAKLVLFTRATPMEVKGKPFWIYALYRKYRLVDCVSVVASDLSPYYSGVIRQSLSDRMTREQLMRGFDSIWVNDVAPLMPRGNKDEMVS